MTGDILSGSGLLDARSRGGELGASGMGICGDISSVGVTGSSSSRDRELLIGEIIGRKYSAGSA